MIIYNCHLHTFTIDHVPPRFIGIDLTLLQKNSFVRKILQSLLRITIPHKNKDLFDRYATFLSTAGEKTQHQVFLKVRECYPPETKFVILPMDMEFMGAGKPSKSIEQQHDELAKLRDSFPNQIIPFAAIDPRRPDVLSMLKDLVEKKQFKGIKLYPPLGYFPYDERLNPIYEFAETKNIPIIAHCASATVHSRDLGKEECSNYANPDHYKSILKKYKDLKICLAHFGGEAAWKDYLENPSLTSSANTNWMAKIMAMIGSGEYENLYTDISYSIFNFKENAKILKVLLENEKLRTKVLFGSDFYLSTQKGFPEKKLSLFLRSTLGEDKFWQIANTNPLNFL
ncbi:amidohydrolase family protein [Desulfovibrio gilichinskyi]|uniref:Amidohydrolase n=1 Tax=Desulfovibrio gilichinskyi TaxID=1519643 RepID=A0A1X7EYW9_9BACT|nr:amidohydrolase family protein [Desulfovibrio gilichinskyi]SMF42746.1 Amidohydrolase [Desulfovibrio gilichinskyi]